MDKQALTKRQQQILDYIRKCIEVKHYPPSVREIGQAIGLSSPSTVHAHLNALEAKGYIKREGAKSRSMVVTGEQSKASKAPEQSAISQMSDHSLTMVPLVGRVAAGAPILAEQNIEEEVPLPTSLFGDRNSFLLSVHGDSMVNAGILDGDTLLVREQSSADNGDIVVAMIDEGSTVKTYYKEKDCIRLQPQNDAMEPIYTRDAQIIGVVTGLFRNY
jgi:repressor LexA